MMEQMPKFFSAQPVKAGNTPVTRTYLVQYLNLLEPDEVQNILKMRTEEKAPLKEIYFYKKFWDDEFTTQHVEQFDQMQNKTMHDWLLYAEIRSKEKWFDADQATDAAERAYYLSFMTTKDRDSYTSKAKKIYENINGTENKLLSQMPEELLKELGYHVFELSDFPVSMEISVHEDLSIIFRDNETGLPNINNIYITSNESLNYFHFAISYRSDFGMSGLTGSSMNSFPHTTSIGPVKISVIQTDTPDRFKLTIERDLKVPELK